MDLYLKEIERLQNLYDEVSSEEEFYLDEGPPEFF